MANPQACFETNINFLFQPTSIKVNKQQSTPKHTEDSQLAQSMHPIDKCLERDCVTSSLWIVCVEEGAAEAASQKVQSWFKLMMSQALAQLT